MHMRPVLLIAAAGGALALVFISVAAADAQPRPPSANAPPPGGGVTVLESRVPNPDTGVALWVAITLPDRTAGGSPVLVVVPGGVNAGSQSVRGRSLDTRLAQAGFAVVTFDPDGRGHSGGVEDAGGFAHQSGLAAVVRWAATQPGVDGSRLGLVSLSYGVTMAAGALARYPDLPVRFLIDWEGPDSRTTTGCRAGRSPLSHPCDDDAYWLEREAVTFVRQIAVPYQRIQSGRDHVQPNAGHAVALVNAATSGEHGGAGRSPWTRLNDAPPNQTYSLETLPLLPEEQEPAWLPRQIARFARDMLAL